MRNDPNLAALRSVAESLGDHRDEVVFVGGATVGLLLTDPAAISVRSTKDVDCIVDVNSWRDYQSFEEQLRGLGFTPDTDGPICRYVVKGMLVDVMPTDERILGFANKWARAAVRNSWQFTFGDGMKINVVDGPHFIATKIEAFLSRGRGEYLSSHDLEDIITVLDGRPELVEEVRHSGAALRRYLALQIHTMSSDLVPAISAHLSPDRASQARVPRIAERIRMLMESGDSHNRIGDG